MFRVNKLTNTITYNGNRIAPIAERAEPRSLQGWWFLRNGQSHVPYEVGGFCGTGRAEFLTVVLFGYLITVSLLQLNLTIQRRSQAHVENFPPSEHICCCIKSLARNILSHKNNKQKDGPPSFEGRYTAFVNLFY